MIKMTNKEIRKDIEKRIVLCNGVNGAFKNMIDGNVATILKQMNIKEKSLQGILSISNMAVSFSIDGFKRAGLINKLYDGVLYERNEKVVQDEIMDYAISKTTELLK
jgi:hypothetical protein